MWRTIAFIICGVLLALASLLPETLLSAFACLVMATILVWALESDEGVLRGFFLFGVVFSLIAFYWLPDTITLFGGFPRTIALLFFAVFAAVSALQFVLCGWLYRWLQHTRLNSFLLALPLAWLASEFLFPRMFPWQLAHSLVAISPIAGLAEYVGVTPLSALLIWWGAMLVSAFRSVETKQLRAPAGLLAGILVTALSVGMGWQRNASVSAQLENSPEVRTALVQGNLNVKEKGDVRYLDANIERYRELSKQALADGAQILLWPESVLNQWTPELLENVTATVHDPFPNAEVPLVYGGLSFRRRSQQELQQILEKHPELNTREFLPSLSIRQFNAAFARTPNGALAGRYYKRVLMPFGEYLPFAEQFPQLKRLSPQTGDFAKGDLKQPIAVPLADGLLFNASILICYEDLVPALSREAVNLGANILLNLTNDAWYGDTAAPYQHHLLAQWRAIEARRFLLRVTNTGFTAVVDPFGRTVTSLPLFEEGYLLEKVKLLDGDTVYSIIGDWPVRLLTWVGLVIALVVRREHRKQEASTAVSA